MFFYISKILSYLLNPFAWVFILLAVALFYKNPRKKKKLLSISFLLLFVFTNPFLADEIVRLWEMPIEQSPNKDYSAGVLLCGDIATYDNPSERIIFRSGADRLLQTIELYKREKIKKIIVSGGSGHLIYKDRTEAAFIKKYLTNIGIPPDDIIFESSSRNTFENARYTYRLLQENKISDTILLITSSLHMRRAYACFKKQGLPVKMYTTSKIVGPRLHNFDHLFIPSVSALQKWNLVIHEMIGYVSYKIIGYC